MKYQSKPLTIDAVKYEPPTSHEETDGNIAELCEFADRELQRQTPWNPADSQNCLLLYPAEADPAAAPEYDPNGLDRRQILVIRPGDYLVKAKDGSLAVGDGPQFEANWAPVDTPAAASPNTDTTSK